ncbi:MAG: HAMP domain-containing protein [Caulobacteraceae bacterium]|nr:HAMP domain-containing protein [Caulobacter sp.]
MSLGAARRRSRRSASLFVQMFALIVLSLLLAQAVNLAIIYLLPAPAPEFFRTGEIAAVLKAQGAPVATPNGRALRAVLRARPDLHGAARVHPAAGLLREELADELGAPLDAVRLKLLESNRYPARRPVRALQRQLGEPRSDHGGPRFIVSPFEADVRTADGRWWVLREEETGLLSSWQQRVFLWFALSAVALAPVAYLFARRLSAPIAAFAAAAERLGRDPGAPPVTVRGSAEIETAGAAFNDMQDELRRYVADRTTMIGAVAHDLRTPLTRLRFRIETAPDPLRRKMAADVDEMEQMIASTMAFVRDAASTPERRPLELSSLVGAVADEMAETGLDVSAQTAGRVVVDGDALALRRLFANLMTNAVKFGIRARARVYADDGVAIVEIDDDGPGVPDSQQELVFAPFHRGEPSRSRETGGAGLGLAVVRSIARAHGGDAELINRSEGGLRVRTRLPLSSALA